MISLLLLVRDITHNKEAHKESVMTIIESNVKLFKAVWEQDEDLDGYCKVFKAQVHTINEHSGNVGYHLVLYQLHLAAL